MAALNDGLDPVAYAANYGIDLNAASGTPITVWNPATNQYHVLSMQRRCGILCRHDYGIDTAGSCHDTMAGMDACRHKG